ncbi:DUF5074 domain-containing protein [Paludibacter sp.]|uniref:YncE family protein n=1 Tax=Paludibacter sp. TaxID=1898105 RepID=UPI001352D6EB|nr:DUF5074 domain-containing protein [Paludibacter sp.]MTK53548.1 YncE family protein [Paludibacter sp.]
MKQFKLFFFLLAAAGSVALTSCTKNETMVVSNGSVYVLNQGSMNYNNSTVTSYNIDKATSTIDWYKAQNGVGLGDTGNDMAVYGGKIYIVVNVSSVVTVTDLNGKFLKTISFQNGNTARQPRCIAFNKNKAYVCSFDGSVARIDTTSLSIEAYATAGENPDGICVANNKLYVSNSGGLNYPTYSNTVSVIDIASFAETKKITVNTNPFTIKTGTDGNVYVLSHGNYGSIASELQVINPSTDALTKTYSNSAAIDFDFYGTKILFCNYDYSTGASAVKTMDVSTGTITNFIVDGTTIPMASGIAVNQTNGDVYVASAATDYVSNGTVYCFDSTGKKKFTFTSGVNPWKIVFVR